MSRSAAEAALALQLTAERIPFEREVVFWPGRRWRLDFRVQDLAIEVEGGGFVMGRHGRGLGIERDAEKHTHIALAGLRLIRVTPRQVREGRALLWILRALNGEASHAHR